MDHTDEKELIEIRLITSTPANAAKAALLIVNAISVSPGIHINVVMMGPDGHDLVLDEEMLDTHVAENVFGVPNEFGNDLAMKDTVLSFRVDFDPKLAEMFERLKGPDEDAVFAKG